MLAKPCERVIKMQETTPHIDGGTGTGLVWRVCAAHLARVHCAAVAT